MRSRLKDLSSRDDCPPDEVEQGLIATATFCIAEAAATALGERKRGIGSSSVHANVNAGGLQSYCVALFDHLGSDQGILSYKTVVEGNLIFLLSQLRSLLSSLSSPSPSPSPSSINLSPPLPHKRIGGFSPSISPNPPSDSKAAHPDPVAPLSLTRSMIVLIESVSLIMREGQTQRWDSVMRAISQHIIDLPLSYLLNRGSDESSRGLHYSWTLRGTLALTLVDLIRHDASSFEAGEMETIEEDLYSLLSDPCYQCRILGAEIMPRSLFSLFPEASHSIIFEDTMKRTLAIKTDPSNSHSMAQGGAGGGGDDLCIEHVQTSLDLLVNVAVNSTSMEVESILLILTHALSLLSSSSSASDEEMEACATALDLLALRLGYESRHEYLSIHTLPLIFQWFKRGLTIHQLHQLHFLFSSPISGFNCLTMRRGRGRANDDQKAADAFLASHAAVITSALFQHIEETEGDLTPLQLLADILTRTRSRDQAPLTAKGLVHDHFSSIFASSWPHSRVDSQGSLHLNPDLSQSLTIKGWVMKALGINPGALPLSIEHVIGVSLCLSFDGSEREWWKARKEEEAREKKGEVVRGVQGQGQGLSSTPNPALKVKYRTLISPEPTPNEGARVASLESEPLALSSPPPLPFFSPPALLSSLLSLPASPLPSIKAGPIDSLVIVHRHIRAARAPRHRFVRASSLSTAMKLYSHQRGPSSRSKGSNTLVSPQVLTGGPMVEPAIARYLLTLILDLMQYPELHLLSFDLARSWINAVHAYSSDPSFNPDPSPCPREKYRQIAIDDLMPKLLGSLVEALYLLLHEINEGHVTRVMQGLHLGRPSEDGAAGISDEQEEDKSCLISLILLLFPHGPLRADEPSTLSLLSSLPQDMPPITSELKALSDIQIKIKRSHQLPQHLSFFSSSAASMSSSQRSKAIARSWDLLSSYRSRGTGGAGGSSLDPALVEDAVKLAEIAVVSGDPHLAALTSALLNPHSYFNQTTSSPILALVSPPSSSQGIKAKKGRSSRSVLSTLPFLPQSLTLSLPLLDEMLSSQDPLMVKTAHSALCDLFTLTGGRDALEALKLIEVLDAQEGRVRVNSRGSVHTSSYLSIFLEGSDTRGPRPLSSLSDNAWISQDDNDEIWTPPSSLPSSSPHAFDSWVRKLASTCLMHCEDQPALLVMARSVGLGSSPASASNSLSSTHQESSSSSSLAQLTLPTALRSIFTSSTLATTKPELRVLLSSIIQERVFLGCKDKSRDKRAVRLFLDLLEKMRMMHRDYVLADKGHRGRRSVGPSNESLVTGLEPDLWSKAYCLNIDYLVAAEVRRTKVKHSNRLDLLILRHFSTGHTSLLVVRRQPFTVTTLTWPLSIWSTGLNLHPQA